LDKVDFVINSIILGLWADGLIRQV